MLKESITSKEINCIFSSSNGKPNRKLKETYLRKLFEMTNCSNDIAKTIAKIDSQIIETWDYEISKSIIRNMFFKSEKCILSKQKKDKIDLAIHQWKELGLGEIKWPFAAASIDNYIHKLNRSEKIPEQEKDKIISKDIIRFRRIKEINQLKNDYIEYLVIHNNENVIPTFGNKRGVDFYIDGLPFDQKVSKSVGSDFIKEYGDDYRTVAIESTSLLAKSLYEHQDAQRFGSEPRFLVVYLDTDLTSDEIEDLLKSLDFSSPMNIAFEYKGNKYKTTCYLILLHR